MYRIGSTKFAFAALLPINTLFLARSGKTLSVLRVIMVTFQGLMTLWLVAMAVLAVMALSLRKKQDLRAPRVADPRLEQRPVTALDPFAALDPEGVSG